MSRSSRAAGLAFTPLTMIVLALVVVVTMAGLGVLSAYSPELKSGNDGGAHALSNSSVGYSGIVKLLRATGVPVNLSRGRLSPDGGDSLLILTPPVGVNPDQVGDRVYSIDGEETAEVEDRGIVGEATGPVLIVLPKWQAAPNAERQGWVSTVGAVSPQDALSVLPDRMRDGVVLNRKEDATTVQLSRPDGRLVGRPVQVDELQTLSGPSLPKWVPVVTDGSGGVVVAMRWDGWVYVISDPDFLNTQALKSLAGAQTAHDLLHLVRAEGSPVTFDLTIHGFQRSRSLLRLMLEPPLLGVSLILAALCVLAGYQSVARFGPAREIDRTVALGKRALADNTAALVRLARREHRMASPYAMLIRAAAARAISAPRALSDVELNALLDRVGAMSGATGRYTDFAESARSAKSPRDLMTVARNLYRWKQELTRGRQ